METWLEWARGPFFKFAFILMILGLARHLVIVTAGIVGAMRRAGDKTIPWKAVLLATVQWLLPFGKVRSRPLFSLASMTFHAGMILTPVLILPHIELWKRGLGIAWPSISHAAADVLTLVTVAAAAAVLAGRLGTARSRSLSRLQDILLPVLIAIPFLSGFLAMHPAYNPLGYTFMMLIHVMSGNVIFILIPFSKLGHMVLLPLSQLVSEVGWHFPADSGDKVTKTLKKENQPI